MARRIDAIQPPTDKCRWVNQHEALHWFGTFVGKTESAEQIKPLHWYVACRLVVEGGFHPDDIWPRPPFEVEVHARSGRNTLLFNEASANGKERTILGGMKTKNVDVVVSKDGIGPVLAVSCKGVTGALRNLTNRMEETIGECTNLHVTYPALVLGYLCLVRANRRVEEEAAAALPDDTAEVAAILKANDYAFARGGEAVEGLHRFQAALKEMQGRRGVRDDISRYEAIALALVEPKGASSGEVFEGFPAADSPIRLERFFATLYARYEERFVLAAPALKTVTRRLQWSSARSVFDSSQVGFAEYPTLDYEPRYDEDSLT
jgi:hypothetical protein